MIIFYLFPFFINAVLKRFRAQFKPQENGWLYLPEHRATTQMLTQDEYDTYQKIFKEKIIYNAIIAILALIALAGWILFVRLSFGYYMIGLFVGTFVYQNAYTDTISQYYNPHQKKKFRFILLGVGVVALWSYCNYRGWEISNADVGKKIWEFLDHIGLKSIIEQYPYIAFGIMILIGAAYSMIFGRMSLWFRPTTKKQRQKVIEERNAPPKEKPWDKTMRESMKQEKKLKKEKKKLKKLRKKEKKFKQQQKNRDL